MEFVIGCVEFVVDDKSYPLITSDTHVFELTDITETVYSKIVDGDVSLLPMKNILSRLILFAKHLCL